MLIEMLTELRGARQQASPPFEVGETGFTQDRLNRLTGAIMGIPLDSLVEAMHKANPGALPSIQAARGKAMGEVGRLNVLSRLQRRFYGVPLRAVLDHGLIDSDFTLSELGFSFGGHAALLDDSLQPKGWYGVEIAPESVAAALMVTSAARKAGLTRPDAVVEVVHGDHNSDLFRNQRTDVALNSLLAQYATAAGALDWNTRHGRIGISGDVIHGMMPIDDEELKAGILPVRVGKESTGLYWALDGRPEDTAFGKIYDARLLRDMDDIKARTPDARVFHFPTTEDTYEGKLTVLKRKEQLFYESWAYRNIGASAREEADLVALRDVLHDDYGEIGRVTRGKMDWNGTWAALIPQLARERGLAAAVLLTTEANHPISPTIIPALLALHGVERQMLAEAGALSRVGEGKHFRSDQELGARVREFLNPDFKMAQKFELAGNPINVGIITGHPSDIQRLAA